MHQLTGKNLLSKRVDDALGDVIDLIYSLMPYKPGVYVNVYGKISQPETFLGDDFKTYRGEVMKIVRVLDSCLELEWTGHKRNRCHVRYNQVSIANRRVK